MRVFQWLNNLISERTKVRDDVSVVLYTRSGCHLCEDAFRDLDALRIRHGFRLVFLDIDADPELQSRFTTCVPVIEVNGRVRQRGRFNKMLFERELTATKGSGD